MLAKELVLPRGQPVPPTVSTTLGNVEESCTPLTLPRDVVARLVKRMIRFLFSRAEAERRREGEVIENFYYSAMYDVLHDVRYIGDKALALKSLKAKIVRLNSSCYRSMWVDSGPQDRYGDEDPSLYHPLKGRKQRVQKDPYDSRQE